VKLHKLFIYLLIASSFLMITACRGGGGDSTEYGEVSMSITDAKPLLPDGATNLWVTFKEVLVHKSGGGWKSLPLPETPYTIDLLQFYDGYTTELVPPVLLEYGKYTQIRLVIDEEGGAWIRFDNDDSKKYPVVIPPNHLKTDKNFTFHPENPAAADIVIDFDLSQSLVVTDDGSGTPSYKLKPVLHIVYGSKAATISGEIVQGSDAIVTVSVFNPDLDTPDYEEYTKVEVISESATEATGFVIFWLVPNIDFDPPQDYKVEIDVDGTIYDFYGIFLGGGDDYFLGTIPPPTP
jgi:hypothetical protein